MSINVSLFDFDGTLTTRDTLLAFIRFAKGRRRLLCGLLLHLPMLLSVKLHLYPNGRAKERLFSFFFAGTTVAQFRQLCIAFAREHRHLLRPQGLETLEKAQSEGQMVFVVSASIETWVRPFFPQLPEGHVVGTQVEVSNGRLTGRFATPNCYGPEKVRRIQPLLPPRHECHITAYGDSRGDQEMFNYAHQTFFQPFRTR